MEQDPRTILFQLKAQSLQLVALEQSSQPIPETHAFADMEQHMLAALADSLKAWLACGRDVRDQYVAEVGEIRSLIATALALHHRHQAEVEIRAGQAQRSLEELQKTLQWLRGSRLSQPPSRLDVVG